METPWRIVQLGASDIGRMRALNRMFGAAFEDPEHYGGLPPTDAYLAEFLAKPHVIALAAILGEEVIGGLVAYELDKFEQARREVYIYDLAVAEAHRRQGVARALIAALQAISRERGAYVIFVQADYGDDPAIALYQSLGAREDVLHFDIPV